jgi:hypothetical protein
MRALQFFFSPPLSFVFCRAQNVVQKADKCEGVNATQMQVPFWQSSMRVAHA